MTLQCRRGVNHLSSRVRTGKQKHLALLDLDVSKGPIVYDTKEHVAPVLIKPFLCEVKV
jgi:hypothetical protein